MSISATIFVIEDDVTFTASLKCNLASLPYEAVFFSDFHDFMTQHDPLTTGFILMDLRLPKITAIECVEELKKAQNILPIIIMSAYIDVQTAVRAMKAGVLNVLNKPYEKNLWLPCFEEAIKLNQTLREKYLVAANYHKGYQQLTKRERQVLHHTVQGLTSKEISKILKISINTAEVHRAKVYKKMHAKNLCKLIQNTLDAEARKFKMLPETTKPNVLV